jgi:hypothetical protein
MSCVDAREAGLPEVQEHVGVLVGFNGDRLTAWRGGIIPSETTHADGRHRALIDAKTGAPRAATPYVKSESEML